MPDPTLSIKRGGIAPLGEYKNSWVFNQVEAIGLKYGYTLSTPVSELSEEAIATILHGSNQTFEVKKE